MTPARFSQVGALLYGPSWRGALADALKVGYRTITRWEKGDAAIPDGVPGDLAALCRKKSDCLARMATALNGER